MKRWVIKIPKQSRAQSTLAVETAKCENIEKDGMVRDYSQIPSAKGLPLIGTLLEYIRGPFQVSKIHEAWSHRVRNLGPIYREKIGPQQEMVYVANAEDASTVYQAEAKQECPRRPGLWSQDAYNKLRGCPSGIASDHAGKDWENTWRQRKAVQKKLLRPQEVVKYLPLMSDITDDFVDILQEEARLHGGRVDDIQKWIYQWSLEAGAGVTFDQRLNCMGGQAKENVHAASLIKSMTAFIECLVQLELGSPHHRLQRSALWRKFVEASDEMYSTGRKMIGSESGPASDTSFLRWLQQTDELTEDEKAAIATQVLAGAIDTTSNAAVLNLYNLAKHPEIQEEVAEELIQVLPDPNQQLTAKHLAKLPLMKACITETFRASPIVSAIGRFLDHEVVLSGYRVPAGTPIMMLFGAMGENEEYFKRPQEFNPHRFLGKDKESAAFKVMPFAHGVRMCPGRRIATLELQVLLARILRRNRLTYVGEEEVGLTFRLINKPDKPVHLGLEERI